MSELLWPMYHDLRKRLEAIEAHLNRTQPDWNALPEPTVQDDYNAPTPTGTDEPEAPDAA